MSTIFLLSPLPPPHPAAFPPGELFSGTLQLKAPHLCSRGQDWKNCWGILGQWWWWWWAEQDKVWVRGPGSHAGELPQLMSAARGPLQVHVFHTRARAHTHTHTRAGWRVHCPPPLRFTVALESIWPVSPLSTQAREPGAGTGQAVSCPLDPESPSLWPLGAYSGFFQGLVGASARGTLIPDASALLRPRPSWERREQVGSGPGLGGGRHRHLNFPS